MAIPAFSAGEALRVDSSRPEALDEATAIRVETSIAKLGSGDLVTYARAAARLIEIGEPAVPALIDAGALERVDFGISTPAVDPIVHRILEDLDSERLAAYLSSRSDAARRSAALHLAARGERGAVPLLLENLPASPRSLRARFFDALRELTGLPDRRPASWEESAEEHLGAWTAWSIARQPVGP
jgi:hypothetical protein